MDKTKHIYLFKHRSRPIVYFGHGRTIYEAGGELRTTLNYRPKPLVVRGGVRSVVHEKLLEEGVVNPTKKKQFFQEDWTVVLVMADVTKEAFHSFVSAMHLVSDKYCANLKKHTHEPRLVREA